MIKIIVVLTLSLFFAACSTKSVEPQKIKKGAKLLSATALGYAYMQNGTKLVYVSRERRKPKDDEEIIVISAYGFYPDYYMTSKEEQGAIIPCKIVDWQNKKLHITKKCDSRYTLHTTGAVLVNLGVLLLGTVGNTQAFDKKYFLEIVEKNNLMDEQKKLLEN